MEQPQSRPFTHRAYIFKSVGMSKGKRVGWWQEEGRARVEPDGALFIYLHSTPLGSFDGRIRCYGFEVQQPDPPLSAACQFRVRDENEGGDEPEHQNRPFTHRAYIFKNAGPARRGGQRPGWWQEEGFARADPEGGIFVYIHSTPIGGFDGRIRCYGFDQQQPQAPPYTEMDALQEGDDEADAHEGIRPTTHH